MTRIVEPPPSASHGKSLALGCLQVAIETNRMPRKAIADEIGKSEQTFSKMTAGTQAFGLDDFERLPRDIQIRWMRDYGRELGIEVRDIDPIALSEEFLALAERLAGVARLTRLVGRPAAAKAGLSVNDERKTA